MLPVDARRTRPTGQPDTAKTRATRVYIKGYLGGTGAELVRESALCRPQPSRRQFVFGGDASSSAGGELFCDDLERRRDRHADDRTDQSEERPERQDAGKDGEAGDLGGLTDDRRLQDVVLNLLVDHHHDYKDDQGLEADRQRDESDDDAGDRRADAGDEVEDPR